MTPHDAAKILDLPADATPEQIEARFHELRARLEDKIAKAPTPGLKAKYRESLEEVTAAFEAMTLAADSSSLPVLSRQAPAGGQPTAKPPAPTPTPASEPRATPSPAAPKAKSGGGKEFLLVAIIAVLALGAGGWWVMKTRAENEEKARLAAEQKAEAERQAAEAKQREEAEKARLIAAEKAEKERLDKLSTSLRSRMAELHVAYDALMRTEQTAERELGELKSQERDLVREQKNSPTPDLRRLSAQVRAQDRLVSWLRDNLPVHPAKVARAKAEELLSARAIEEAAAAVDAYAAGVAQLRKDISDAKLRLAVTGPLQLASNLEGTTWQLTDAFGVERSGSAPAQLDDVALGKGTITFRRAGWPDLRYALSLAAGGGAVAADFPTGTLRVTTEPAGAIVYRDSAAIGTTPLELAPLPPGPVDLRVTLKGYRTLKLAGAIEKGRTLDLNGTLVAGRIADPEFIIDTLLEEVARMPGKPAASVLLMALNGATRDDSLPQATKLRLVDAHLAACRAITAPDERITALGSAMSNIVPSISLERADDYTREAAKAYQVANDVSKRTTLVFYASYFAPLPSGGSVAAAMTNWFQSADDWIYRANVAQLLARTGNDAAAERVAASAMSRDAGGEYQSDQVRDYLRKGRVQRITDSIRRALWQGDLAGAQRGLAGITPPIENADVSEIAAGFMRLGDFDSPLAAARLAQAQYVSADDTLLMVIIAATTLGHFDRAEQWIMKQGDTTEKPSRSQSYRFLARMYLNNGRKEEAARAAAKSVVFNSAAYASDRIETALLLLEAGMTDRARELARGHGLTFTKEDYGKLMYAPALFVGLGDTALAERALRVANESNYSDFALVHICTSLGRQGRFDEITPYLGRIRDETQRESARSQIEVARVAPVSPGDYDQLIERAAPGVERARLLATLLWLIESRQGRKT